MEGIMTDENTPFGMLTIGCMICKTGSVPWISGAIPICDECLETLRKIILENKGK